MSQLRLPAYTRDDHAQDLQALIVSSVMDSPYRKFIGKNINRLRNAFQFDRNPQINTINPLAAESAQSEVTNSQSAGFRIETCRGYY